MSKIYSIYEAKAKFSEVLRQVREGRSVTISYHGEPVAEIRPLQQTDETVAARLQHLEERGVVIRPGGGAENLGTVEQSPGALKRFLQDRNG